MNVWDHTTPREIRSLLRAHRQRAGRQVAAYALLALGALLWVGGVVAGFILSGGPDGFGAAAFVAFVGCVAAGMLALIAGKSLLRSVIGTPSLPDQDVAALEALLRDAPR